MEVEKICRGTTNVPGLSASPAIGPGTLRCEAGNAMLDLTVTVTLNNAHYQEGSIVLTPSVREHLGKIDSEIMLWLGEDRHRIHGRLERHGGTNRSPVIHGGYTLRSWLLKHCQPGDTLEVRVLGPVQFWLRRV